MVSLTPVTKVLNFIPASRKLYAKEISGIAIFFYLCLVEE